MSRIVALYWVLFVHPLFAQAALSCRPQVTIGCTTGYCGERVRQAIRSLVPSATQIIWRSLPKIDLDSERLDGVISPGGKDLTLATYLDRIPEDEKAQYLELDARLGKHTPQSMIRDRFELNFWKSYFSQKRYRGVAALGICYGHQAMAVSNGFALYSDLRSQLDIPARYQVEDSITFSGRAFSPAPIPFLAREEHHQAVRKLGTRQEKGRIFATSHDGKIIEGIRYEDRPAYSVQFHPELSRPEVKWAALRPFVQAICGHQLDPATMPLLDSIHGEASVP